MTYRRHTCLLIYRRHTCLLIYIHQYVLSHIHTPNITHQYFRTHAIKIGNILPH